MTASKSSTIHKTIHSSVDESVDRYNNLLSTMSSVKDTIDDGDDEKDETDHILSNAIDLAIQQGRGWGPGEKQAYLEKILDDDFIPPLFATNTDEVANSGLEDAFTTLIYDGENPTTLMLQFRKKGNDAYANGKRNQANNLQYYRDAINHYYEARAWALKIEPMEAGDMAQADVADDIPTYTEKELNRERGAICANIALMHLQLKNWGFVRDESEKALQYDDQNIKAWFRLAKAYQQLQEWEAAGDALEKGLEIDGQNSDLLKLQTKLYDRIRKARKQRQQRERARAERVAKVKDVWKHCNTTKGNIQLGKVPLVNAVMDEEEDEAESRWHAHLPHSGHLPQSEHGEWRWPCMFLYPSHQQSDFIAKFAESEMMALRLAEVFPELDEAQETAIPWDHKNEFTCSKLAVYFEVHATAKDAVVHPEHVQILKDQASTMRFYEASRALKGDEGSDTANLVTAIARKHLHEQRVAWKKKHNSLWNLPDPNPVVRVHPAMTLGEVLRDERMIVPNFLVTFYIFPESHPAHDAFLKEHKCVGILQPKS